MMRLVAVLAVMGASSDMGPAAANPLSEADFHAAYCARLYAVQLSVGRTTEEYAHVLPAGIVEAVRTGLAATPERQARVFKYLTPRLPLAPEMILAASSLVEADTNVEDPSADQHTHLTPSTEASERKESCMTLDWLP
jgi:hypothetical protein